MFEHVLVWGLWLAWGVVWLAWAWSGKATLRSESPASRMAHGLPLLLGVWLLVAPTLPPLLHRLQAPIVPWNMALYWTGVAVLAAGLALSIWARWHLGRNWSATVAVKAGHELVRSGPYAWVRHPIYSGLMGGFLGTAVVLDQWRGVLALAIMLAAIWRKLHLEERFMLETFGQDYAAYRQRVRALVPGLL